MLAAVVLILLGLFVWFLGSRKKQQLLAKIPGPRPWPIIANTFYFKLDGHGFYTQLYDLCTEYQDKSTFKVVVGPQPFVYIYHPETAEILYTSTKHISKPQSYDFLHPWLGTGLVTSTGVKWWTRRKMLTPTFHFGILADFLHVFNEHTEVLIKQLREKVGKESFDVFPFITLCTLDVICETAMGRSVNAQHNADSDYVAAVRKISKLVLDRSKLPWLWPDIIYNCTSASKETRECLSILHGYTRKVIGERKAELEANPLDVDMVEGKAVSGGQRRRLAFLDLLLQMAKDANLTLDDIQEEVDTFMFAGHDTTAAATSWSLYMIGRHPEVQTRLQEEVDDIFGDSSRAATMQDLTQMKYLERVIKETLRLCPSVPVLGRVLEEDTVFGDYTIPKGSAMMVVTYMLHRDPKHYPDPERFDPDRFTLENSIKRHPFAYTPFSAGQRNCIGQKFALQEVKVLLSSVLRHFNIEATQTKEELCPLSELILRPKDGIHLKLTERGPK